MFRPLTGLPDPAPRRSRTAFLTASAIAAVSLVCAAAVWIAAAEARAGAAERLRERGDDFVELYLLHLDEIVRFRFTDSAVAYLAVAVLFASLAVAIRFGPQWSVAATGLLSGAGTAMIAWFGLTKLTEGLPLGDWAGYELTAMLQEAAPSWYGTADHLPLLATAAGLPLVLVLLAAGRARTRDGYESEGADLGW
ncbi:hypothetical protein GCM10009853_072110 [Glycomyces scopariae]|uniref:Uncharacterized protein n=1 Tax=Glycomyces sambucus TaxID=380244 RepID=A0A1G9KBA4_9ACTN|nr:hypothetical protein [Glycomyces sambucus]SDL46987.1 hypothetical protein SAMN05216298_3963 [Glycomyces sambucus]